MYLPFSLCRLPRRKVNKLELKPKVDGLSFLCWKLSAYNYKGSESGAPQKLGLDGRWFWQANKLFSLAGGAPHADRKLIKKRAPPWYQTPQSSSARASLLMSHCPPNAALPLGSTDRSRPRNWGDSINILAITINFRRLPQI